MASKEVVVDYPACKDGGSRLGQFEMPHDLRPLLNSAVEAFDQVCIGIAGETF